MVLLPIAAYSAYLAYSRIVHRAGPWHDWTALIVTLLLGLPFAILSAQSFSSRIFAGLVYLMLGGLVSVVYSLLFVGIVFDLWL